MSKGKASECTENSAYDCANANDEDSGDGIGARNFYGREGQPALVEGILQTAATGEPATQALLQAQCARDSSEYRTLHLSSTRQSTKNIINRSKTTLLYVRPGPRGHEKAATFVVESLVARGGKTVTAAIDCTGCVNASLMPGSVGHSRKVSFFSKMCSMVLQPLSGVMGVARASHATCRSW